MEKFIRDPSSNALINIDQEAFKSYKKRRQKDQTIEIRLLQLEQRLEKLEKIIKENKCQ